MKSRLSSSSGEDGPLKAFRSRCCWCRIVTTALVAVLLAARPLAAPAASQGQAPSDVAVKAAFLFNFAKFTTWPGLAPAAPITICVIGHDGIAAALVTIVRGQTLDGHPVTVQQLLDGNRLRQCQMVFVAGPELGQFVRELKQIDKLPVLTVSDGKGFSLADGMVEFYFEDGRLRFAVNLDVVERSGLTLSSRLLALARIVRTGKGVARSVTPQAMQHSY